MPSHYLKLLRYYPNLGIFLVNQKVFLTLSPIQNTSYKERVFRRPGSSKRRQ